MDFFNVDMGVDFMGGSLDGGGFNGALGVFLLREAGGLVPDGSRLYNGRVVLLEDQVSHFLRRDLV